jgi:hypothetical protein
LAAPDNFWKELIETWRNKQIQASCRREDAEGLDLENVHFLSLALQEVRQTVSETIQVWIEGLMMMDQCGSKDKDSRNQEVEWERSLRRIKRYRPCGNRIGYQRQGGECVLLVTVWGFRRRRCRKNPSWGLLNKHTQ